MSNIGKPRYLFALLLCAIAPAGAYAATPYVMRDLGILSPAGAPYTDYMHSVAYAINESGVVAGDSGMQYGEQPTTPFLYANGTLSSLSRNPNPWASDNIVVADINNLGQVVGGIGFTLLYENGSWVSLGANVTPSAINDEGVVVGGIGSAKYYKDGSWHEIAFYGPNNARYVPTYSAATAITNDGVIVGYAELGSKFKIFNAGQDGEANFSMYSEGYNDRCNYHSGYFCYAYDINGKWDGTLPFAIVGKDSAGYAILNAIGGYTSLLVEYGEARAINSHGQIVGWMQVAGKDHAFLWDNGELIDLGTFGGTQSRAYDINDAGQIVGWAMLPGDTAYHAFLAEPVPEPETWATLLAGLGLLGFRLRRRAGR